MGDSPGHVEAPCGRPQGRRSAVVRHRRAAECGISRQHLHRLLARYREGGLDALESRSRVTALGVELVSAGLDAGPATIAWHLAEEGLPVPSASTVRRILHAAGLVAPEPHKRPRSSWIRFEASAPNEVWQSDFTRVASGTAGARRAPRPRPTRPSRTRSSWRGCSTASVHRRRHRPGARGDAPGGARGPGPRSGRRGGGPRGAPAAAGGRRAHDRRVQPRLASHGPSGTVCAGAPRRAPAAARPEAPGGVRCALAEPGSPRPAARGGAARDLRPGRRAGVPAARGAPAAQRERVVARAGSAPAGAACGNGRGERICAVMSEARATVRFARQPPPGCRFTQLGGSAETPRATTRARSILAASDDGETMHTLRRVSGAAFRLGAASVAVRTQDIPGD